MVDYIGQTIQSVVSQNYPNLEYIVIDGASTDGTTDIIDRYSDKIDVAISEPDDGQYHAIQKGFEKSSGDIMGWLNADDMYYPWTLSVVGEIFGKFPDVNWIIGLPSHLNRRGQCTRVSSSVSAYPQDYIRRGWFRASLAGYLQQESIFWRRSLWEKVGCFDLSLPYAADFKLWTQFAKHSELVSVAVPLALFRHRPNEQKSSLGTNTYEEEVLRICKKLKKNPKLWAFLAGRNKKLEYLCRLAIWKKCRVIAYSQEREEWVLRTLRRPLSRASLSGLILENSIR
jgi:glycosyltransferase involved in cell wall biosynthesis